jgi:radical SAM enzyme (TIGR01210 family)
MKNLIKLRRIMKHVRAINRAGLPNPAVDSRGGILNGEKIKRAVISLKTSPCRWLESIGGCTMCSICIVPDNHRPVTSDIKNQFDYCFRKFNFRDHPEIDIYTSGSFFDDCNMSAECRDYIFRKIAGEPHIKKVVIESRPEFISREKVEGLRERLNKQKLEIALGVESTERDIRMLCINKTVSDKAIERAVTTVKDLCDIKAYILLKPPFLTEAEAVLDAVRSIDDIFSLGARSVSLEVCNVREGTLTAILREMGKYRVPWLWSIIEILTRVNHWDVFIGGLFSTSKLLDYSRNCEKCTHNMRQKLIGFNQNRDIEGLLRLSCECKAAWRREFSRNSAGPIEKRMDILDDVWEYLAEGNPEMSSSNYHNCLVRS